MNDIAYLFLSKHLFAPGFCTRVRDFLSLSPLALSLAQHFIYMHVDHFSPIVLINKAQNLK